MANTVREDGTKWNRWQDQPKVQKACNAIEHRYGLRIVEAREHARGARADSAADLRASARRGQSRTDRDALEKRVRAAATSANSEVDFILRLRELGVRARPRFAKGAPISCRLQRCPAHQEGRALPVVRGAVDSPGT